MISNLICDLVLRCDLTVVQDRSIAVWDMHSPTDITLRRVLVGHRAAVNVVDFDTRYIVSASGDRTIKVWCTSSCEFVRTLNGHKRGIACLQYHDKLVVSGSSDNTIRSPNIALLFSVVQLNIVDTSRLCYDAVADRILNKYNIKREF